MENKLNLDPQTILDKEFHVDFKGYSPAEVDEFRFGHSGLSDL